MRTFGKILPNFIPDIEIIIQYRLQDGAFAIKSGTGQPINATFMCSLFAKLISANLDNILQQQSMIIQPKADEQPPIKLKDESEVMDA